MNSKLALITGGSRGLGRDGALHLADRGTDVVITYHSNRAAAESVVATVRGKGRKCAALQLDVGDVASFGAFTTALVETLARDFDRNTIDYLVNNAGHGLHKPFVDTTVEEFDGLMNVHLKGVFFLTQKLLPILVDGGRILNVSSGLARFSLPGTSAYGAMKGAVEVLTRYLAKELGARGIRVNVLAPGAIATDFGGGAVRDNKQLQAHISANTGLGRVGQPEDIGAAIAVLLSDETGWITGQRIEASGGMFL